MTEKNYGGNTGMSKGKLVVTKSNNNSLTEKQNKNIIKTENSTLTKEEISNYRKSGKIARGVVKYAKSIIKPNMLLLEIAEKIETEIEKLGEKPAFPVNLSINEIAAHCTPSYNDETKAFGLLKIDIGVHIQGAITDTAFTLDLENSEENKKLILASEKALEEAIKTAKKEIEVYKIGERIHNSITSLGFSPIRNLSGHELGKYKVHAGLTIPNYNNNNNTKLPEGVYAIEPFSTTGQGIVYEGKPSGIYRFKKRAGVRDNLAREIMNFVEQEYSTLPFCSRWIIKKFSERAKLSLNFLEKAGIIHQYPQLVEKSHEKVSQAETTILITENKVEVLV